MKEDVRNVERRSEIKMETLVFFFFFETLVFISENENGKKKTVEVILEQGTQSESSMLRYHF